MNYNVLLSYMKRFSTTSLKKHLGEELFDSLIEWEIDSPILNSKRRISEMILSIYGLSVLKNKDFRLDLLNSFSEREICELAEDFVIKDHNCSDIKLVIEIIANKPWRQNPLNNRLLEMLDILPDYMFDKTRDDEIESENISSFDKFYELLDYQYVIRQRALNILNSQHSLKRFLIHMPTGTGKTKTATHIISHYYNYSLKKKGLVIWIAHTKELLQQAYDTFKGVWKNIGNGDINVYKLWGNYKPNFEETKYSGLVVCGIQKLQSIMSHDPELFQAMRENVRLIVYDEAHKATAKETKEVVNGLMNRKGGLIDRSLMGLTATPGRTSDYSADNNILVSMFGNKIIEVDTRLMNMINMSQQEAANAEIETDVIQYFQKRGVLAKIEKEELRYQDSFTETELNNLKIEMSDNGYYDFTKKALEIIGSNKSRNLEILKKIGVLNANKVPTIVFACSVKHGQLLSSMLTLKKIPNALVIGDMSAKEREEAIRKFKDEDSDINVLINYEVLTTGFDATNIECVFIARPTQSVVLYSQMLGRGLRGPQMGGKEKCLLIDVKDNLRSFNENMAFSHFNNYWNL